MPYFSDKKVLWKSGETNVIFTSLILDFLGNKLIKNIEIYAILVDFWYFKNFLKFSFNINYFNDVRNLRFLFRCFFTSPFFCHQTKKRLRPKKGLLFLESLFFLALPIVPSIAPWVIGFSRQKLHCRIARGLSTEKVFVINPWLIDFAIWSSYRTYRTVRTTQRDFHKIFFGRNNLLLVLEISMDF